MPQNAILSPPLQPASTFSPWKDDNVRRARLAFVAALQQGSDKERMRARFVAICGVFPATFLKGPQGTQVWRRARCRNRLCAACAKLTAAEFRRRFVPVAEHVAKGGGRISLFTLTLPHKAGDSLRELFRWLEEAWRRFYRSRGKDGFQTHVHNWLRSVEFTETRDNGAHPHIHFLAHCGYWPHADVLRIWARCVKAAAVKLFGKDDPRADRVAEIVHVKEIHRDPAKGVMEAVGYCCKTKDLAAMPKGRILDIVRAIDGKRLVSASHGWSALAKALPDGRNRYKVCLAGRIPRSRRRSNKSNQTMNRRRMEKLSPGCKPRKRPCV